MKHSISSQELIGQKNYDIEKEKLSKIFSLYQAKSPLDALIYMEELGGIFK